MLNQFLSFIDSNRLFARPDPVLLTVSGGIDSIVMLDLFYRAGFSCSAAHCNFKLRGTESDEDEAFVKELAANYDMNIFHVSFNTEEYAASHNMSIQMAARELRYEWFEETREKAGCEYIATAHNKNDVTETFFINLSRGTGIKGLTGIKEKSGNLIRPLLFASREQILEYAMDRQLAWREDSSNATTKYARNKIRHNIIPELEDINPRFIDVMFENVLRLRETGEIFQQALEEKKHQLISRDKRHLLVSVEKLKSDEFARTWLYGILSDFNFTATVVDDVMKSLDGIPGKIFLSPTHRLVKDRDSLIIEPLRQEQQKRYYIENPYLDIEEPLKLCLRIINRSDEFVIPRYPDTACLDFDRLEFPLIIRKWEKGDYFQPLGMENMKKVSDFFVDNKLSIPEKENTWLLTSGKDIVWIIGKRIDDRFKITPSTLKIFQVEVQ